MPRISRKLLVHWESTHHCTYRSHNGMDLFAEPLDSGTLCSLAGINAGRRGRD